VRRCNLSEGEDALVARPELEVDVKRLPTGATVFIAALQRSANLAEAASVAAESCAEFDLQANMRGIIESRVVARIVTPA
jgi:hypothetical protein